MSHLRTIEPIKALKGRLSFLKVEDQPILARLKLVNSLSASQEPSKLSSISLEEIKSLESTNKLTIQSHNKLLFEINVHKNANPRALDSTIYEQLDKHQKRVIMALLAYTNQLNARQLLYLQYIIRKKVDAIYPNWSNLHFNPDSPYRRDFVVLPCLKSIQHLYELRTIQKKKVMSAILAAHKQSAARP